MLYVQKYPPFDSCKPLLTTNLKGHKMTKQSELFKVISGNAFSQGDTAGIGRPVWLGPWHRLRSSKAHNVYYNKKVLPTNCSNTKDKLNKGNWLNRLNSLVKFSLLYDIFAFGTILLGLIFLLPLFFAALGVG
tara:strand:+ start:398 stop:796 length:399 start_codon:yes stop_codon:yes gene_type:complete